MKDPVRYALGYVKLRLLGGSVQFVFTAPAPLDSDSVLIIVLARYCSDPLLLTYDSLFSLFSVQTIDTHDGPIDISAFQSLFSFSLWLFLSFSLSLHFPIFAPSFSSSLFDTPFFLYLQRQAVTKIISATITTFERFNSLFHFQPFISLFLHSLPKNGLFSRRRQPVAFS